MISEEQEKNIKEQLLKQIDSWEASQEKKEQAKKYIHSLKSKQLEEFLIKNNMFKPNQNIEAKPQQIKTELTEEEQKCPFCLISQEKIPAYKIDENKQSLAILEINPLSKGHVLIIPKEHEKIEKLPSQAFSLSKKIASKIKRKLKPKETSIQTAEIFGHAAINIIPMYEDERLEKKKASEPELKELQEKLKSKPKLKREKPIKEKNTETKKLPKAPVRIP